MSEIYLFTCTGADIYLVRHGRLCHGLLHMGHKILFDHQLLEDGYANDASAELNEIFRFQLVEDMGDIDSTIIYFLGQTGHFDVDIFFPSWSDAMCLKETDDAPPQVLRLYTP